MKKIFLALLVAALLISGTALADSRAAELDGRLFLSLNGVLAAGDSMQQLDEREIRYLQSDGEYLYYVVSEETDDSDIFSETLMRMDAEGKAEIIGEARLYGEVWNSETDADPFLPGYGDMTVYDGHIYFVGAKDASGSYTAHYIQEYYEGDELIVEKDKELIHYETTSSVYRMNLDGSKLTELIPNLGNGLVHMDVNNGKIAVASCWINIHYEPYNFSNFMLYSLRGKLEKTFKNKIDRHVWHYKDDCEFTCIVEDIHTDGKTIYASLGDSEGDFASSRLTDMSKPGKTLIYEAYYTPSVVAEDGIASLTSDATDAFYHQYMKTSLHLRWSDGEGSLILAYIPEDFAGYGPGDGDILLSRVGDMLYLTNGEDAIRVSIHGGDVERLGENGFEPDPALAPENYQPTELPEPEEYYLLPDSDSYLYSRDELEEYDTETLGYMRNEILARHGYVFKKQQYKDYFGEQSWYTPNPDYSFSLLNEIEAANVETIKDIEADR